jgi:hypothetical protein
LRSRRNDGFCLFPGQSLPQRGEVRRLEAERFAESAQRSLRRSLQYAGLNVDDLSEMQFGVTDYIANLRKQMSGQAYNERPIYRPQLIAR